MRRWSGNQSARRVLAFVSTVIDTDVTACARADLTSGRLTFIGESWLVLRSGHLSYGQHPMLYNWLHNKLCYLFLAGGHRGRALS